MTIVKRLIGSVILSLTLIGSAYAETADVAVAQLTQNVIDVVMTATKDNAEISEFAPKLDSMMADYADFDWIAKNIMGSYRKKATPEQVHLFGETFRQVMIQTYAKSFLAYDGQKVTTYPVAEKYKNKRRVPVKQTVEGIAGGLNIVYTMGQKKDGRWVMLNLRVNGVNLGQTYQQQFSRMMKEFGMIDQVISRWGK